MKRAELEPGRGPRTVEVVIECSDLPPSDWGGHSEIWLGIQCREAVVQEVKLPAEAIRLRAEFRIGGDISEGAPNFLGPYAFGTVQERFLYLCWGRRYGGTWVGFRRAKLPLSGLSWESIQGDRLVAKLKCTDSKGGPICATVKSEFLSWSSPTG